MFYLLAEGADRATGVWVCCAIVVVFALAAALGRSKKCELCGSLIKRTYYTWTIQGKKMRLCPRCNGRLENKKSKQAVDRLKF